VTLINKVRRAQIKTVKDGRTFFTSWEMFDLGLTELDVPDEEPVLTAGELAFDCAEDV
jgi:hypothetical protein